MAKQKYNWDRIKAGYMASEIMDAEPFLKTVGVPYNRHTASSIKGWGDEKREMQSKIYDAEMEKLKEEEVKRFPQLLKAKMNIIADIAGKNVDQLSVQEKRIAWTMLKTELGEPTAVQKNINEELPGQEPYTKEEIEELRKRALGKNAVKKRRG